MNSIEKIIVALILVGYVGCGGQGGPYDPNKIGGAASANSNTTNNAPEYALDTNKASNSMMAANVESNQSNITDMNQYFASKVTPKSKASRNAQILVKETPKSDEGDNTALQAVNNSNKSVFANQLRESLALEEAERSEDSEDEYFENRVYKLNENRVTSAPSSTSARSEIPKLSRSTIPKLSIRNDPQEGIDGFWLLENNQGKKFELSIYGSRGTLIVRFTKGDETITAEQDITARQVEKGILVTGSDVRFIGNYKIQPVYNPDKLFFELQPGDSIKVWEYNGDIRIPVQVKRRSRY